MPQFPLGWRLAEPAHQFDRDTHVNLGKHQTSPLSKVGAQECADSQDSWDNGGVVSTTSEQCITAVEGAEDWEFTTDGTSIILSCPAGWNSLVHSIEAFVMKEPNIVVDSDIDTQTVSQNTASITVGPASLGTGYFFGQGNHTYDTTPQGDEEFVQTSTLSILAT